MTGEPPELNLSRRNFMQVGVATLASIPGSAVAQQQNPVVDEDQYSGLAVLEGPLDARPTPDDSFFDDRPYYAYRYVDEVTKASWYITDELERWHPEPVGAADVEDSNGEDHAVSIVSRDGGLYVRRYQ